MFGFINIRNSSKIKKFFGKRLYPDTPSTINTFNNMLIWLVFTIKPITFPNLDPYQSQV